MPLFYHPDRNDSDKQIHLNCHFEQTGAHSLKHANSFPRTKVRVSYFNKKVIIICINI